MSSVFFMFNLCLSSLFIASIINLLNLPSSFLARFIIHTDGLFWKFSLWSLSLMKQLLSLLMSMRRNASLSFEIFFPLMLILFLMLLFNFYIWKLWSYSNAYYIDLYLTCTCCQFYLRTSQFYHSFGMVRTKIKRNGTD